MRRQQHRGSDERGVTVLEVTIASMLLVGALATFLAGLSRTESTSNFASKRQHALDDLRLAAAEFTRDARQASEVTAFASDEVTFDQFMDIDATNPGSEVISTHWEVFADASGDLQLRRTRNGAQQTFLVKLTSDTVFEAEPDVYTSPGEIRRLRLFMSTKPLAEYPDVDLTAEVTLRNVG